MSLTIVKLNTRDEVNIVLGQCHDSQAIDQINVALTSKVPDIKFGIAYHQRSNCILAGAPSLAAVARDNLCNLRVNDLFFLIFDNAVPQNVLTILRGIHAIDDIYCAASGSVKVIIDDSGKYRSLIGLADEYSSAN